MIAKPRPAFWLLLQFLFSLHNQIYPRSMQLDENLRITVASLGIRLQLTRTEDQQIFILLLPSSSSLHQPYSSFFFFSLFSHVSHLCPLLFTLFLSFPVSPHLYVCLSFSFFFSPFYPSFFLPGPHPLVFRGFIHPWEGMGEHMQ